MADRESGIGSESDNGPGGGFDIFGGSGSGNGDSGSSGFNLFSGAVDPGASVPGPDTGDGDDFDPNIHIGRDKRNADGSYRRKRQRRGTGTYSRSTKSQKDNGNSVEGIEFILNNIHAMLAVTVAPELALEANEGRELAQAIKNVERHYDIPQIAQKTIDWCGLLMCLGKVYGPRAYNINQRMKEERATKVGSKDASVTDLSTYRQSTFGDGFDAPGKPG